MKKVLILTASYGEGHNAAARGLRAGFEHIGGVTAEVLDVFADTYGVLYDRSRRNYLGLIDRAPRLWWVLYNLLDHTPLVHAVARALSKLENELERVLEEYQPDAVVSTYPIYNYLLNRIRVRKVQRPFGQSTVVTDSITVNSAWYRANTDLFFVPNEDTARAMKRSGVPGEKLCVLGFPVPPRFAFDRPERPLPGVGQPSRVLYMINAAKERAPALVERLLQIPSIELTVTVGKDEALRAAVEAVADRIGRKLEVHGWTPRMPELLMTHHVLIGKAGGAAVQEAVAARTPMIITQVVPGQEEGNARLLIENNCGRLAGTPDAIARTLEEAFSGNAAIWREWEANITRLSRPDAAMRIAEAILQTLPGAGYEASHQVTSVSSSS
ncbi:MGDG synthase family glycosyltransferase [Verrucomicrobiota bacterium sgz303538]